ncbi:unnamed protein product [Euphydryas editha]|uniref:Cytochrome P450 n=1 Tax=Euphydryas editha TaxID=104508 RepID=A0AAU9V7H6_EUPED|nr:unnamed protein product [Euphydryas editha]
MGDNGLAFSLSFCLFNSCMFTIIINCVQLWLNIDFIYKLREKQDNNIRIINSFIDNLISRKKPFVEEGNEKIGETNKEEECDRANKRNSDEANFKTISELVIKKSTEIDKEYTNEELREESVALGLAGETSSIGTSFVFLLLSQHQNVQDRVYKE